MATHIFIDKENGETGTAAASKYRLRLLSVPSKAFVHKSQPRTPLVGRAANVNSAASQSARKALGNVNRPLSTPMTLFPKGKKFSAKKATEKMNTVESCGISTDDCPEKENLFLYDPLDFESFEVPEEHKLSHMPLTGVPLMTFEKADRFTGPVFLPVMPPPVPWDYEAINCQSTKDYLSTLDEIMIDLPSPL